MATHRHRAPQRERRARRTVARTVDRRTKLFNRVCAGVLIAFALLWLVPLAWAHRHRAQAQRGDHQHHLG